MASLGVLKKSQSANTLKYIFCNILGLGTRLVIESSATAMLPWNSADTWMISCDIQITITPLEANQVHRRLSWLNNYAKKYYLNPVIASALEPISIPRCCLISIWIPIIKIRWSHHNIIVIMQIPIPRKEHLHIKIRALIFATSSAMVLTI